MKKMLKIMAMLLVIGAVVFAAGCAEKKSAETGGNVSSEGPNVSTVVGNETPGNVSDNFSDNFSDNVSDNATENATENATA